MPRKRIEIDLAKVEELASRGLNEEQIALILGISESTIQRRKNSDLQFLNAIKKGRATGMDFVVNKLFEAIKGGAPWAICFFLKCRGGQDWREQKNDSESEKVEIVKIGRIKEHTPDDAPGN